jgi:hypothetical protein
MQFQEQIVKIKSKGGRPSKSRQLEIRKILQEHFDNGKSAHLTSQITGINIKTVSVYFKEFEELITHDINYDFVTRQQIAKEFAVCYLQMDLDELEKMCEDLKKKIKLNPKRPVWHRLLIKVILSIVRLRLQKAKIEMTPTLRELKNYQQYNQDRSFRRRT